MTTKNYLMLCGVVAVAVVLAVLYVPGVAETIEQQLLTFLSSNAR
jgi:hypothetical protein